MIVDCRDYKSAYAARGLRAYVDGREILKVWYADTDEGLVKTVAIHQFEGCLDYEYAWSFEPWLYPDWELENHDHLVSRTLRGHVELRASDGQP